MPKYIFQSKSLTKGGKSYDLEAMSYVFDCPECELVRSFQFDTEAITCRNIHFNTTHPELHLATVIEDAECNKNEAYDRLERVCRSV
jgi:hypothetical protein